MRRTNPVTWLGWSVAAALVAVSTRNPLYLVLLGAAVGAVYLSLDRRSAPVRAWSTVLRVGALVATISILFNALTVHTGSHVIFRLPGEIPIVGGPITLNALVYGVSSAITILNLLVIGVTFNSAVDRAELLRLVPRQFVHAGMAALIALSIFPQILRALREVREAQMARGFQVRSARDLPPLIVPILHLAMEHALNLAEAIESRAFGHGASGRPANRLLLGLALAGTGCGVVLFGLGHSAAAAALALASIALFALAILRAHPPARGRYRPLEWTRRDLTVAGSAAASALLVALSLATSDRLSYSPYPYLTWPPFAVAPGLACALLVAPALILDIRTRR